MCPLKPLPLKDGGWVGVAPQVDVSSRGVDPPWRVGDASWGLFPNASAPLRSVASAAALPLSSGRRPGQWMDRTRRAATRGAWGATVPPCGAPLLSQAGLQRVSGGQEGGHHRGDERGVQACLHRAGALGIHRVQAMERLLQCDAAVDLPADPRAVGHWPGPKPRGPVREEAARALRGVDPHQAQRQGLCGPPHTHLGSNGVASADKELLLKQDIEVGAGAECRGDLTTRQRVDLRLPVVLEADHQAHPLGMTGPQPGQARRRQVRQQTTTLPGLVDLHMPAVMLAGRAEMVAYGCPAADGEDLMPLERRIVPSKSSCYRIRATSVRTGVKDVGTRTEAPGVRGHHRLGEQKQEATPEVGYRVACCARCHLR
jgi:hypothetical protein